MLSGRFGFAPIPAGGIRYRDASRLPQLVSARICSPAVQSLARDAIAVGLHGIKMRIHG